MMKFIVFLCVFTIAVSYFIFNFPKPTSTIIEKHHDEISKY